MTASPAEIARYACEHLHASQRLDELAQAVALVEALQPRIVVEIGCDAGGTLYCWRQLGAEVYGITLPDNSPPTGGQGFELVTFGAHVLRADSHDPTSLSWLVEQLDGRPVDVLHIDGDHSYGGVALDFAAYSPLVRPGGLVLVHDVLNPHDKRVDVPRWWAEITAERPDASVIASRRSRPVGFGVLTITEEP